MLKKINEAYEILSDHSKKRHEKNNNTNDYSARSSSGKTQKKGANQEIAYDWVFAFKFYIATIAASFFFSYEGRISKALILGFAQWLILREKFPKSYTWIIATTVGWAFFGVFPKGMPLFPSWLIVSLFIGISQWFILEKKVEKSGLWILAVLMSSLFLAIQGIIAKGSYSPLKSIVAILSFIMWPMAQSITMAWLLKRPKMTSTR